MKKLLLEMLLLLVFSGCTGSGSTERGEQESSSPSSAEPQEKAPTSEVLAMIDAAGSSEFTFLPPIHLRCGNEAESLFIQCGSVGEPVIEVAPNGLIWYSAANHLGFAPPIWISSDGGNTFGLLQSTTGVVRHVTGAEGDLAIDEAGHVYFADVLAGKGSWFTSYDQNATHRWTVPFLFPQQSSLYDRPWLRAGRENEVFLAYSTGTTWFSRSEDGGLTWGLTENQAQFPCTLGVLGQGNLRSTLFITAACNQPIDGLHGPSLWLSTDSGRSWQGPERIPLPAELPEKHPEPALVVADADAAGNIYVTYAYPPGSPGEAQILLARRNAEGAWAGPWVVSTGALNAMPWVSAGEEGHVAVAWYGSHPSNLSGPNWYLNIARSIDAHLTRPQVQRAVADPFPVFEEQGLARELGDFLQVEIMREGRVAVGYTSQSSEEGGCETVQPCPLNLFVLSVG